MLDIRNIREQKDLIAARLARRSKDFSADLDQVIALDDQRKAIQLQLDTNLARQNELAKSIGALMKDGKKEEAEAAKQEVAQLKLTSKDIEENKSSKELEIKQILLTIPNAPAERVPTGKTPEENEIAFAMPGLPTVPEGSIPHWDLAKKYDLIDFETGVKIAGAGFPLYKGKGARLQRALINFFLDEAEKAGFQEVQPPIVVNEDSGYGTGQLPDKEGQMYYIGLDNLYLVPTAEVPVTNIYRDTILKESDFPIQLTAYTPCFRREAGSYGKDVRGLNRLHQFDKVEIVVVDHPENSYQRLEEMRNYVAGLLEKLGLHYRTLLLCGGDMGFASAMTYDMEVYSAAQERWLEVSSVSNFESFQANRLQCRFKGEDGKTRLVHTLNGSALALPRIVASLLENNQTPEGIRIPACLVPYTGFDLIS
ncbi:MAG: seryl-tRNA synthetase [Bacteroidota bacterium]|jgi:seryl-tRNA synthetase